MQWLLLLLLPCCCLPCPDNVIEYIHRLADFRLHRQLDRAAAAFLRGFFEMIRPRWVRMFNESELQMLISGSEEGIDVDDLMHHINYAGGGGGGGGEGDMGAASAASQWLMSARGAALTSSGMCSTPHCTMTSTRSSGSQEICLMWLHICHSGVRKGCGSSSWPGALQDLHTRRLVEMLS
jgi:hypothetical protein